MCCCHYRRVSYSEISTRGLGLDLGLEDLASASWFWPRPRPQSFGLGLSVLASFNITGIVWHHPSMQVVNIVYIISAMSVWQSRQNAYLHNLFQANTCYCFTYWVDICWKLCEITIFWHNSVSRNITRYCVYTCQVNLIVFSINCCSYLPNLIENL